MNRLEYVVFVLLVVYLMPWMFAEIRDHEAATRILWFNLLLGWTLLGWLAAWLWARSTPAAPRRPELVVISNPDPQRTPPRRQLRSAGRAPGSDPKRRTRSG